MEQNMNTAMPAMNTSQQGSNNGFKIATAIASVIAICGIGFGIFGMVQSAQKDNQISDLKIQIKNDDGTVTTIEPDDIIVKEDAENVVIIENVSPSLGFMGKNFVGSTEFTASYMPDYSETIQKSFSVYTEYGDRYTLYNDGKVTATIISQKNYEEKDITSKLPGRVVDMAIGTHGNGDTSWIIFILEDGTAATLWELSQSQTEEASLIEGATDIVKIYGTRNSVGPLGYAQDKSGKIYDIVLDSDGTTTPWKFKLAD